MKPLRTSASRLRKPAPAILLKLYRSLRGHYGHRKWWPGESPFEVIVGAILTQNTSWKNVEKAIANLKKAGVLTPGRLSRLSHGRLASLIRPAGYFNVKADRIRAFMRFLNRHYEGNLHYLFRADWRKVREELLSVRGIGPETADAILLYAGQKPSFVVDTYTRRLLTRHQFIHGSETYEEIRNLIQEGIPRRTGLYNDYHAQIVEVGKHHCRPQPRCKSCPLHFDLINR